MPVSHISCRKGLAVCLLLAAFSSTARGDAVWQSLFFERDVLSKTWWVIPVGLTIEFPAVVSITKASWLKSAWITILMNGVSFILGAFLQMPSLALGGI